MKRLISIVIVTFLLIGCAKSQKKQDKPFEKKYIPTKPILINQNDSLNYTYGISTASGTKDYYPILTGDQTAIYLFIQAIDNAYISVETSDMFKLGVQIGNSFKQHKAKGLMSDSTLKYEESLVKKGFLDALNGNYSSMKPQIAETFLQNKMQYFKNNPSFIKDTALVHKLNYAFGMANGDGVKKYYKEASTKEGYQQLIAGLREGIKINFSLKYDQIVDVGTSIGLTLKEQNRTGLMGDTTLMLNKKLIKQGIVNYLYNTSMQMSPNDAISYFNQTIKMLTHKNLEIKYGDYRKMNEEFLEENSKKIEKIITTASGLQYEIISNGKGQNPKENDKVKVHYHGTLIDGTVFDSTIERNEPIICPVNQVIKGWYEALKLMSVGSKYKLYIPYKLAYGDSEQGKIKPFSTLIFELELISIEK
jgi:FKBP-type peptidyl-prolyl cis-trans isomerase